MGAGADTSASDKTGKNALRVARIRRDDVMVATLQGLNRVGSALGEATDLFSTTCITTVEEAKQFSLSLKRNTTLEKVTLSGSTFGVAGMQLMADSLVYGQTTFPTALGLGSMPVPPPLPAH